MDKLFHNTKIKGALRAISSKSEAHRYLICAALGDRECLIECTDTNADIDATAACLNSLGAEITRTEQGFLVVPIKEIKKNQALDCNESGSTLRFLLPLTASLGANPSFLMHGRLPQRPLSPLYELLEENGIVMSAQGTNPLRVAGKLHAGHFRVAANVSSQYISGLLMALSVAEGESTLTLDGKIESAPYIEMTVDALKDFGAEIQYNNEDKCFTVMGKHRLTSPTRVTVGGDWSNAAFPLVAGAIGQAPVTVTGLVAGSRQGDRAVLDILKRMGASVEQSDLGITVSPSPRRATAIDAADIPDLVPILAVAASVAEGETTIYNAARLRLKESDRIESVCATLRALGAEITPTADGMVILGKKRLTGGSVDSHNDHRIAMSAAIASLVCESEVKISRFEAINKSYPSFEEIFLKQ